MSLAEAQSAHTHTHTHTALGMSPPTLVYSYCRQSPTYSFDEVLGLCCEVRRKAQPGMEDLVNCPLTVLSTERRLATGEGRKH